MVRLKVKYLEINHGKSMPMSQSHNGSIKKIKFNLCKIDTGGGASQSHNGSIKSKLIVHIVINFCFNPKMVRIKKLLS